MTENQTETKEETQEMPLAPGGRSAVPCSRRFRAADTVHHKPSGEDWTLANDEENGRVQPCGWPESMAEAKDCTLIEAATEKARSIMLHEWAREGKGYEHERDSRTRTARRQLSSENDKAVQPRERK